MNSSCTLWVRVVIVHAGELIPASGGVTRVEDEYTVIGLRSACFPCTCHGH